MTREPGDQRISFSSLSKHNDSPRKWSMLKSRTVLSWWYTFSWSYIALETQDISAWVAVIRGHVILLKSKQINKPKKSHNGMSVKHVFAFSKQNYFKLECRRNGWCSIADFLRVSRPIPSHGLLVCRKYNDIEPKRRRVIDRNNSQGVSVPTPLLTISFYRNQSTWLAINRPIHHFDLSFHWYNSLWQPSRPFENLELLRIDRIQSLYSRNHVSSSD